MKQPNAWNPRWRLLACAAPAAVFFAAFWLLPVVRLLTLPVYRRPTTALSNAPVDGVPCAAK